MDTIHELLQQDTDKIILVIAFVAVTGVLSVLGALLVIWRIRARSRARVEERKLTLRQREIDARRAAETARENMMGQLMETNRRFGQSVDRFHDTVVQVTSQYAGAVDRATETSKLQTEAIKIVDSHLAEQSAASAAAHLASQTNIQQTKLAIDSGLTATQAALTERFDKIDPALLKLTDDVSQVAGQISTLHQLVASTKLEVLASVQTMDARPTLADILGKLTKLDNAATQIADIVLKMSNGIQVLTASSIQAGESSPVQLIGGES